MKRREKNEIKKVTLTLAAITGAAAFMAQLGGSKVNAEENRAAHYMFQNNGDSWDGNHYYLEDGTMVYNAFFCDGRDTYYLQADGTPMKDRLTYHPDGIHIIYLDANGHEVFSDFSHISKSIAGADVDDMCFFDMNGYMYVETMAEIQAVEVMSALMSAGVQFSAATKGEDKVGITVSKNDVSTLNDVMYASIGKIAHTDAAKENGGKGENGKYETINPEYYASLGKDDKHTRVESIDTARNIVAELQKANIPYSAVVRKNDTVAVTVSKANSQAYQQIESAVKGKRAVEYVNPDYFKTLPKQERFTQRMGEGQARKKSAELTSKGVEHSAVFGGEKSAVTVAKKDSKKAFFSRGKMQRDAQRISGRGQQKPQQTPKKRNDQGLE